MTGTKIAKANAASVMMVNRSRIRNCVGVIRTPGLVVGFESAASDWAVTVSAAQGAASYTNDGEKAAYAWFAGGLFVLFGAVALLGRRWGR